MKNGYRGRGGEGDPKDLCSGGGGGVAGSETKHTFFPIRVQVIWRFVVCIIDKKLCIGICMGQTNSPLLLGSIHST